MTPLDSRALRQAFGSFMTGVTVVTSHDAGGRPIGFTANSFTSVSLDPPLLLVCLANSSRNYDALVGGEGFAVNVLAETQIEISNTFARPAEDRFAGVSWHRGPAGSPLIDGVSAWFDCSLHKTVEAGDHVILIGEVRAFGTGTSPGLGYARGAYVTPAMTAEAAAAGPDLVISALIERDGAVLLVDDGYGGSTLPEALVDAEGAAATMRRLIAETGLSGEPGFVYSIYEDVARKRQHIAFLCHGATGTPSRGVFVPLDSSALDDVSDPAILAMLDRFTREAALGDFGIYSGNQRSGEIRQIA
ncbi:MULTISPECIES: flavin reductase [unclassified Phaeobacter]|uniref:flavin reductase n=1 Tax=unclassified Phaeobacter TaxID=2621772 RepID=UPI003A887A40